MRVLLIDNYDSFTYMLRDYIEQCGAACEVIRNDAALLQLNVQPYDAVVISPGPATPAQSGQLMPFVESIIEHKPVLGICLGHQAIGEHYGAALVRAAQPVHGKVSEVMHEGDEVFNGIPQRFSATRYHSLLLRDLPPQLRVIARTASGEIMALRHNALPVWGIQFHPESCLTPNGLGIIRNFLSLAVQSC